MRPNNPDVVFTEACKFLLDLPKHWVQMLTRFQNFVKSLDYKSNLSNIHNGTFFFLANKLENGCITSKKLG